MGAKAKKIVADKSFQAAMAEVIRRGTALLPDVSWAEPQIRQFAYSIAVELVARYPGGSKDSALAWRVILGATHDALASRLLALRAVELLMERGDAKPFRVDTTWHIATKGKEKKAACKTSKQKCS